MRRTYSLRRADGDDGVVIVLVALAMVAMLIIAAIVIDVGFLRGSSRFDQKAADLAALAGGKQLSAGNYEGACEDVISYLNANAPDMPTIAPSTFCSGGGVGQTICSTPGGTAQATPTTTVGRYTIALHFPVTNAEIADPKFGAGTNDGTPCERMRIIVTATEPSFFGGIVGNNGFSATRSATVKASFTESKRTPALWLLDPTGCPALNVTGGSKVTVGNNAVPGLIAVDSNGTTGCSGSKYTISTSGSGSTINAQPSATDPGEISLFALPTGANTCVLPACNPSDVASGAVSPQPQSSGERATRAPVDWKFNCNPSYPNYHGVPISGCPAAGSTPPYIDLLRSAFGNGAPSGYTTWSSAGYSCNAPANLPVLHGNWWVDCPSTGLTIGNGVTVTFADGNVVFDGGLKMTGGALNINTNDSTANLPDMCKPPAVTTPCVSTASETAGIVYVPRGGIDLSGGAALTIHHAAVYVNSSGSIKVSGGSPPSWTAPTEGPLAGLALWAEGSGNFNFSGGTGPTLSGSFFTPEADMTLSGNGVWSQPISAQFISHTLTVTGGATFTMAPDPYVSVNLPPKAGVLIR